ncbi:hypothetical protein MMC10_000717 [Thelotrema lepadinum]|nr:hypothetical protein [Thelotrema lepadinum]
MATTPTVQCPAIKFRRAQRTQLSLVLHTAVSYIPDEGAGIGIVQEAECARLGTICTIGHQAIAVAERKHEFGYTRQQLEKGLTVERLHMLAMIHALCLAGKAARRIQREGCYELRGVVVFCESAEVVGMVNEFLNWPGIVRENEKASRDGEFLYNVGTGVGGLAGRGLRVAIRVSEGNEEAEGQAKRVVGITSNASCRALRACKRKGMLGPKDKKLVQERKDAASKVRLTRRKLKRELKRKKMLQELENVARLKARDQVFIQEKPFEGIDQDGATGAQGTFELAIRPKEAPDVMRHEVAAGDLGTFELVMRPKSPLEDIEDDFVMV